MSGTGISSPIRPWLFGLIAALGVCAWQSATVAANYGGNWTALFCSAGEGRVPPELEPGTYRFPGTPGYDGQYYRLIAHDPWMTKGYSRYIDDANLRYRRILQPALAWLLAGGVEQRVDAAYYVTVWLLVLGGTALCALYLRSLGWPDYLAMLFPVMPGVLVCADRMTVDLSFYVCLTAALVAAARGRWALCFAAAVLAGLSRDLGLIVAAALALSALTQRRWTRAALFASAALPTFAWYAFIQAATAQPAASGHVIPKWAMYKPLIGHFQALVDPASYPMGPLLLEVTQTLDRLVLVGIFAAACVVVARLRNWPWTFEQSVGLGFVAVFLMVGTPYFWRDLYSSFRAFTPLLVVAALAPGVPRAGWHQLPLGLMTFRFLWQLGPQLYGILRHWGLTG